MPLHELRRRFELNGQADDVCPVQIPEGSSTSACRRASATCWPSSCGSGDVGLELCRDPLVPIVMGVFPMRPVVRS